MKIGIDARMYGPSQGGIGRYIEQLIKHLQKIDQNNQYILFLRQANFTECEIINPNFKKVLADIPWYSLKEQTSLTKIIAKEKVDLMHFPHWNVPLIYRGKFVLTIHDLIMYHFPRTEASTHGPVVYWFKDRLHRLILSSAAKRATAVIATSEFTKNDITKELKINPKKITVTYQAPFSKNAATAQLPDEIKKPYALYIGTSYPHKNLLGLLRAWKKIESRNQELSLVLTGRKNFFYDQLIDSTEFKNCHRVAYLPNPTDQTLETLYQNASLFVFPSLYEGFGLPPLEAMLRNVPVVSSNTSCLQEILGNAAWYFDPNNTEDMARKILMTFENPDLRNTLQKNGEGLVKNYSWEKLTYETLLTYQKSG
jgi:glycosyltransferase involved in cell wall biosynthesis